MTRNVQVDDRSHAGRIYLALADTEQADKAGLFWPWPADVPGVVHTDAATAAIAEQVK